LSDILFSTFESLRFESLPAFSGMFEVVITVL